MDGKNNGAKQMKRLWRTRQSDGSDGSESDENDERRGYGEEADKKANQWWRQ